MIWLYFFSSLLYIPYPHRPPVFFFFGGGAGGGGLSETRAVGKSCTAKKILTWHVLWDLPMSWRRQWRLLPWPNRGWGPSLACPAPPVAGSCAVWRPPPGWARWEPGRWGRKPPLPRRTTRLWPALPPCPALGLLSSQQLGSWRSGKSRMETSLVKMFVSFCVFSGPKPGKLLWVKIKIHELLKRTFFFVVVFFFLVWQCKTTCKFSAIRLFKIANRLPFDLQENVERGVGYCQNQMRARNRLCGISHE